MLSNYSTRVPSFAAPKMRRNAFLPDVVLNINHARIYICFNFYADYCSDLYYSDLYYSGVIFEQIFCNYWCLISFNYMCTSGNEDNEVTNS